LDRLDIRLRRAMSSNIASQRTELTQIQRTLLANSPKQLLERNKLRLDAGRARLEQSLRSVLASRRSSLQTLSRSLNSISPLSTLARGYSITLDSSSNVIRSTEDIKVGATITSRLGEGEIVSTVSTITKKGS
jgi:exodeoxyribonuclease VII large subunit